MKMVDAVDILNSQIANLKAENFRLREALTEIVEHGESDCYVIALHALKFNDVKNDVDKHRE